MLVGTCVSELSGAFVFVRELEVRIFVWLTAATVAELSNENVTVLKSGTDDRRLEMYTVESVAVIVLEAVEKLDIV